MSMRKELFLAAIIALSPVCWFSAKAQLPAGLATGGRRDKSIEDKYRSDEMERVRRAAVKPVDHTAARFPQIKEDFERIQIITSELLQASDSHAGMNHAHISEAAADIRKRATRLQSNLFPSPSKEGRQQIDLPLEAREDLKLLLTELDKAVNNFAHNPMFQNTRVVNPQDSSQAERELQKIIILSGRTRKTAVRRDP